MWAERWVRGYGMNRELRKKQRGDVGVRDRLRRSAEGQAVWQAGDTELQVAPRAVQGLRMEARVMEETLPLHNTLLCIHLSHQGLTWPLPHRVRPHFTPCSLLLQLLPSASSRPGPRRGPYLGSARPGRCVWTPALTQGTSCTVCHNSSTT